MRLGLALVLLICVSATSPVTAETERRVQCSFDRMAGFNVQDGKTERTRADLPVSWSIVAPAEGGSGAQQVVRQRAEAPVEMQLIETPSTVNWHYVDDNGGIELTTIYRNVVKAPKRYLAVQSRTGPTLSGAQPELSLGTCRVDPPF